MEPSRKLREICRIHVQICKCKTSEIGVWIIYFAHTYVEIAVMFLGWQGLHFGFALKILLYCVLAW